jgi:hypothetical protein
MEKISDAQMKLWVVWDIVLENLKTRRHIFCVVRSLKER